MRKTITFFIFITMSFIALGQNNDVYETSVTFPADYQVGDYVEFVKVTPAAASASGYYEISISYTRNNMAAAATHIASVSHSNPTLWREAGRVNANDYTSGVYSFTVDCNKQHNNARFRVRAIATYGTSQAITVYIKVRSINRNLGWQALSQTGNDLTVTKLLPMTREWNLYTGNAFSDASASIAIKATFNGNIGIGTSTPNEKLTVNGKIRAKEIKVETANWPDYVFKSSYPLMPLTKVESFIKEHGHLPEVPSVKEVEKDGIEVGANQAILLKKIEELTLYIIEQDKQLKACYHQLELVRKEINDLKNKKSNRK